MADNVEEPLADDHPEDVEETESDCATLRPVVVKREACFRVPRTLCTQYVEVVSRRICVAVTLDPGPGQSLF
jgi:hypothetical protein